MANRNSVTVEVDPISRIEGHLGVKVTTNASGIITNAQAHGNLWRGFENFLLGRTANDAITFVQRICGVCPVPHGLASTHAVDTVLGYSEGHITFADNGTKGIPAKAVSIRNLVLGAEFLMSSITHFYHLAAPSYIQGPNMAPWTPYFNDGFYHAALLATGHGVQVGGKGVAPLIDPVTGFSADVWSTVIRSYVVALRIRRLTFEAGALFAGRMPMTSVFIGGGVTFDGTEDLTSRCTMYENIMKEVGLFVIQEYVPIALALGALYTDYDNAHNVPGSLEIGSGLKRYLSWGCFPASDASGPTAALAIEGGYKDLNGGGGDFTVSNRQDVASQFLSGAHSVPSNLTEDIASSRYQIDSRDSAAYGANTYAYPGAVSRTSPKRSNGYTYMKAPRWNQKSCEVGPLARMMVSGLFTDNVALATSLGAYYTAYVKTAGATPVTGLDPAMISADVAVALLNAGLATLTSDAVTPGQVFTSVVGVPHATIVTVYTHPSTVITGTIAGWVIGLKAGASTMDRLRARAIESLYLVQQILGLYNKSTNTWAGNGWVGKLKTQTGGANDTEFSTWKNASIPSVEVQGWGAVEAPRGALMHQMTIKAGKITKYQCIVPTTWNGSPVIGDPAVKLNHGAIEASCIDAPLAALPKTITSQDGSTPIVTQGGVEVLRCAQSFDPCIACAIH